MIACDVRVLGVAPGAVIIGTRVIRYGRVAIVLHEQEDALVVELKVFHTGLHRQAFIHEFFLSKELERIVKHLLSVIAVIDVKGMDYVRVACPYVQVKRSRVIP